jgi:hypothetical protein
MSLSKKEPLIVLAIFFLALGLNFFPFLWRSFTTPENKVFTGAQFYTDDYAVYVSYLKQGEQGRWTVTDKYTHEPHPASLIHEEYLLWGKLWGWLGVSPILAYHLGRLVFGLLFLSLTYLLLLKFFPGTQESVLRLASLALICFSAGFIEKTGLPYLNWLTEVDPTQRLASLMHYLIGFDSLLAIFIIFWSQKKNWLWVLALSIITGFILPSSLLMVVTTLLIFGVLTRFSDKGLGKLILVLLLGFLPFLLYSLYIFKIPPWSHILALEKTNRGPFTLEQYLLSLGIIAFVFPLGLLDLKNRRRLVLFLLSWIAATFIWIFGLADIFGFNPTRFLQIPVFIPLAVLGVLGVSRVFKKPPISGMLICLMLLAGLPTIRLSFKNQLLLNADYPPLVYPNKSLVEAMTFLEENSQPEELVLTFYYAGNLLPFFSGNQVYLGHLQETLDYDLKAAKAKEFFVGKMAPEQARQFLEESLTNYVFWAPQEKSFGGRIDKYSFLAPVFNNEEVIIFRFQNH